MITASRRQDTGEDGKGETAEASLRCLAGWGRAGGEHPPDCHPQGGALSCPVGTFRTCVKP